MVKKTIVVVFLVLITVTSVFGLSLEFDTRITNVQMHPDFWMGIFPTSVSYAAGTESLQILPDRKTDLFLELGTGTLARKITRDPVTGVPLLLSDTDYVYYFIDFPDYDVMYAAWTLEFSQGIIKPKETEKDYLTVSLALDGKWEISLNPILQTTNRLGSPFDNIPFYTEDETVTYEINGTPDLAGNRNLVYMNYRVSGVIDNLLLITGSRNGIKAEFEFIWAPEYLNFTKKTGGKASFYRFWAYANGGTMIMQKKDENDKNVVSVGFSYDVEFRYLDGKYVPKSAEKLKGSIWFYEPENMTYLIRGTAKLDLYGPQFMGSCIPRVYGFFDFSYAWGKYNNAPSMETDYIATGSYGIHLEIKLFGALALYYEIGDVFLHTGDDSARYTGLKHSDGLKIAMELSI